MAKTKRSRYTAAPEPPTDPAVRKRYEQVLAVMAGTQTVAGAARELGMPRNHFQTIMHRGLAGLLAAITPRPVGRPAKPTREATLEKENEELRAELEATKARADMLGRLATVVSDIASGRTPLRRARASKSKAPPGEDPEPASAATRGPQPERARPRVSAEKDRESAPPMLRPSEQAMAMRDTAAPRALCAAVLGISESTLGRRLRATVLRPPRPSRAPRRLGASLASCDEVRRMVRVTHGLAGAASLGKRCGVSRRLAAQVKRDELTRIERERKARCARVVVTTPGVARAFDAMHVRCVDGVGYLLVASDAAVPFRTSIHSSPVYDAAHVIAALAADFDEHGAPLVLRLDRIACHRTLDVDALLARYGVLAIHGPPRHPQYYGQLERQNRDHRAWLAGLERVEMGTLSATADAMRTALNASWPRPTLGWCTAAEAWDQRPPVDIDRTELRRCVDRRAAQLIRNRVEPLRARRFAIESALIELGLLTITPGGSC